MRKLVELDVASCRDRGVDQQNAWKSDGARNTKEVLFSTHPLLCIDPLRCGHRDSKRNLCCAADKPYWIAHRSLREAPGEHRIDSLRANSLVGGPMGRNAVPTRSSSYKRERIHQRQTPPSCQCPRALPERGRGAEVPASGDAVA